MQLLYLITILNAKSKIIAQWDATQFFLAPNNIHLKYSCQKTLEANDFYILALYLLRKCQLLKSKVNSKITWEYVTK